MLQLQIIAGAQSLPIYDLPAALGRRGAAKELGEQIDLLIAFLDELGGDPDLEDSHDAEADDTDAETRTYPEFHTLDRVDQRAGRIMGRAMPGIEQHEDAEDDDPREDDDEDCCIAGDDHIAAGRSPAGQYLANLAGWTDDVGDDDDAEPLHCQLRGGSLDANAYPANDA